MEAACHGHGPFGLGFFWTTHFGWVGWSRTRTSGERVVVTPGRPAHVRATAATGSKVAGHQAPGCYSCPRFGAPAAENVATLGIGNHPIPSFLARLGRNCARHDNRRRCVVYVSAVGGRMRVRRRGRACHVRPVQAGNSCAFL